MFVFASSESSAFQIELSFTANMPLWSKCLLIRIFLTCKCYYSIFVFSKIFVRQSQVIFIIKFHHHFHHHHHQTPNLRNSRNSRNSHTIDRRQKLANLISVGLSFCDQVVAKQAVASCIGKEISKFDWILSNKSVLEDFTL